VNKDEQGKIMGGLAGNAAFFLPGIVLSFLSSSIIILPIFIAGILYFLSCLMIAKIKRQA